MSAAFEASEYRQRVRAVTDEMQTRGIDTLVVVAEANLCYLTGYEGFSDCVPQAALLRAEDEDVMAFRVSTDGLESFSSTPRILFVR